MSASERALRALRDCGVVSASPSHAGLSRLVILGLATMTFTPQRARGSIYLFRLTPYGLSAAEQLPPTPRIPSL